MSTPAQITANQANAKRSTGPATAEGKARSALNSLRHGLTSREVVIPPGQEAEFANFQQALSEELLPSGATEEVLFRQLVHAAWNLERIRQLQAATSVDDPKFALLLRYEAHSERSFERTLKMLRQLQTLRFEQELQEIAVPQVEGLELPPLADPHLERHRKSEAQAIRIADHWMNGQEKAMHIAWMKANHPTAGAEQP